MVYNVSDVCLKSVYIVGVYYSSLKFVHIVELYCSGLIKSAYSFLF